MRKHLSVRFMVIVCGLLTSFAYTLPAQVVLSTDFQGRTVSGLTANNIVWSENGLAADDTMTAVHVMDNSSGDLFDTLEAQGHFAVDNNIGSGGIWEADVTGITVTGAPVELESLDIGWQNFSNAGAFQLPGVNRSASLTISVEGSTSGPLGMIAVDTEIAQSGMVNAAFTPSLMLTSAETYTVTINAIRNPAGPAGFNFGFSSLAFNEGGAPPALLPPASFSLFRGFAVNGAGLAEFLDSDDNRANYNPGFTINDTEAPAWLIFDANGPAATGFVVESNAGTPGLEYTVEAFNWAANAFDVVGVQGENFNTDQTLEFAIVPADHVDTNGDVRTRVGWRAAGFTINFPWEVRVDQVGWLQ